MSDSVGRAGEQLSRTGPSAKTALIGQALGRACLHWASLSGSAGRKLAARATRKCPDSRALGNHNTNGHRRFGRP